MSVQNKLYWCKKCGNIIQVVHADIGQLICCAIPMIMLEEQTADYKTEKHVPIIEKTSTGYLVKIGSEPHPMEEEHYIEWIELIADGVSYRQFLKPSDKPEAHFNIEATEVHAREYCNVHKLWRDI